MKFLFFVLFFHLLNTQEEDTTGNINNADREPSHETKRNFEIIVKDSILDKVSKEIGELSNTLQGQRERRDVYFFHDHMKIVKPDPTIDYKIIVVKPDSTVDYKMLIREVQKINHWEIDIDAYSPPDSGKE